MCRKIQFKGVGMWGELKKIEQVKTLYVNRVRGRSQIEKGGERF